MRTTHVRRSLLPALIALSCAGCVTAEFRVTQVPQEPFNEFFRAEVSTFRLQLAGAPDPELLQDGRDVAEVIKTRLTHRLEKSKMFDHPGRKLLITGRIVEFDPGSQAARYFIGPCAGPATMRMEVSLLDEAGSLVAQGTVLAELRGGFFGGSLSSLGKKVADTLFVFIKNNYKGIPKPAEPPVQ